MSFRTVLLLAAIATALPACTVNMVEPGAVSSDGTVYLGFNLFDARGKPDREDYQIGQQLGAFSSIRLKTDAPVAVTKVHVIFADGER
ncbi:unnamed protein product, partial [marine sediment metagenome]